VAEDAGGTTNTVREAVQNGRNRSHRAKEVRDQIELPNEGIPKSNGLKNAPVMNPNSGRPARTDGGHVDMGYIIDGYSDGSMSYDPPSSCISNYQPESTWRYSVATSGTADSDNAGDEVEEGKSKYLQLQSYFPETPDPFAAECDRTTDPYPVNAEFYVTHDSGDTSNLFVLDKPRPDEYPGDDSNGDDGTLGLLLDVVGAAGGTYWNVASSIIDWALNVNSAGEGSPDVTYSQPDNGEAWTWDMDKDMDATWPTDTDHTAGVRILLEPVTLEPGQTANMMVKSKMSFAYISYPDGSCPCDQTNHPQMIADTGYTYNFVGVDCIPIQ
jgi:hypothetical protein